MTPSNTKAPTTRIDITGQVRDAFEDHGPPIAYHRDRRAPRPFQVIVTCPGTDNTGEHPLSRAGTWTR